MASNTVPDTRPAHAADWDPREQSVLDDQTGAFDRMREHCPVAWSETRQWSVFRHADVCKVLDDPETFSSEVSRHRHIPGGMDRPEHTTWRRILDPYLSQARVAAFEPACQAIAENLVQQAVAAGHIDGIADLARPFAVHAQCAYLGWPAQLRDTLDKWTAANHAATLARDRPAMRRIAQAFEGLIDELIAMRRDDHASPETDLTAALMHEHVDGRPITNREIASILRTWTVGEIGSIAAAIGIIMHFLARHPEQQQRLREHPEALLHANDEILRLRGPLVASRRVATRDVDLGERRIAAGEQLSLNWVAANRDPAAFDDPEHFDGERDADNNLLYGRGLHACPGAALSRMEMRVMIGQLLQETRTIRIADGQAPEPAVFPVNGAASLPLILT